MLSNFHFHHIGYAVTSIEKTMYYYIDGGYSCSSVIFDPIQNVNICFLTKEGEPMIELLEPVDENSPINKNLEKNGVGIVEWKPEQVQRFDIKHGKNKSVEIQAIDFIRTSPFVQEEVKRASENIKLTNFARLLGAIVR